MFVATGGDDDDDDEDDDEASEEKGTPAAGEGASPVESTLDGAKVEANPSPPCQVPIFLFSLDFSSFCSLVSTTELQRFLLCRVRLACYVQCIE